MIRRIPRYRRYNRLHESAHEKQHSVEIDLINIYAESEYEEYLMDSDAFYSNDDITSQIVEIAKNEFANFMNSTLDINIFNEDFSCEYDSNRDALILSVYFSSIDSYDELCNSLTYRTYDFLDGETVDIDDPDCEYMTVHTEGQSIYLDGELISRR